MAMVIFHQKDCTKHLGKFSVDVPCKSKVDTKCQQPQQFNYQTNIHVVDNIMYYDGRLSGRPEPIYAGLAAYNCI